MIKVAHKTASLLQKQARNGTLQRLTTRYCFSSQTEQNNKEKVASEKTQRQIEIEHRKKLMEEHEIKMLRNKIENTKGNYNPIISYIRLHSHYIWRLFLLLGLSSVTFMFLKISGIDEDAFTGKKKIMLISKSFEKTIDEYLRTIAINQLCNFSKNQKISESLSQKVKEIQQFLSEKTGRIYKIMVISTQQHAIIVLPSSIIISKNLLVSKNFIRQPFFNTLLLMEGLFAKRFHIKDLAISNIWTFAFGNLKPNPLADLKLTSIYARKYSVQQFQQTIIEVAKIYQLNEEELQSSIAQWLRTYISVSGQSSPFSLAKRFERVFE